MSFKWRRHFLSVAFGVLCSFHQVWAENSQKEKREALENAQKTLTDPKLREEAMKSTPQAKMVDVKVKNLLGGGQDTEQLYKLASDVLTDIAKKSNGDPEQMKKLLMEGQQNPEAFYKSLDSSQQSKISDLSKKAEERTSPPPAPK